MKKLKWNKQLFFEAGMVFLGICFVIYPAAIAGAAATCTGDFEMIGGVCVPTTDATGLSSTSIRVILYLILDWILGIIGVISIIMFVVSGFQYLTAAGDEKQIEIAKRNIKYSIIGLTVALTSFLIIELIDALIVVL